MDDFILFSNSKEELKTFLNKLQKFCEEKLRLELKPFILGRTKDGFSFLGYLVTIYRIKLTQKSNHRKLIKLKRLNYDLETGKILEEEYFTRVKCMYAVCGDFLKK